MKRMKKLLAFLLAAMLLLTMIPISASAADDAFTIEYENNGGQKLTVNLYTPEGELVQTKTVSLFLLSAPSRVLAPFSH